MIVRGEVTLPRLNVADLRRPDDLPFRVSGRDLVPIRTVASAYSFACTRVAVAEGEQLETRSLRHYHGAVAARLDPAQSTA
jgi:hypothetical protein